MTASPAGNAERTRLLLADDHVVVRQGLIAVLKYHPGFEVVAEASDGTQAVEMFRRHRPDVAVLDIRMPGCDGIEAAGRIRAEFPNARLLMLTTYDTAEDVRRARAAGVNGYVLKTADHGELTGAILAVRGGGTWFTGSLSARAEEADGRPLLTARQLEVLDLLAQGLSNKEIAAALGFTIDGTKAHLRNIFQKLGVQDRTQALRIAVERGLIRLDA
jgi:two-component system NarL family response regulator